MVNIHKANTPIPKMSGRDASTYLCIHNNIIVITAMD